MATFTIDIPGLPELLSAFAKAGVQLPEQFQRAMVLSVKDVKEQAQRTVPIRTGALRNSIFEIVTENPLIGQVGVSQPYGKYIEYGTRPHVIEPVNAQALRFVVGGNVVFTKRVQHPGTAAKPFLEPALENKKDTIRSYFQRALDSVLNELKN